MIVKFFVEDIFVKNQNKNFMKYKLSSGMAIGFFFLILSCSTNQPSNNSTSDKDSAFVQNGGFTTQAEWGKHIVAISGCEDCHTPKNMTDKGPVNDASLMLSGASAKAPLPDIKQPGVAATYDQTAWIGPWGKSYAANITPDSTGIGNWSESQFINCLKKGLYKGLDGSRPLMPPMPWQDYSNMSDNEMKAVFAYLKTVKPVHNIVPDYAPPVATGK